MYGCWDGKHESAEEVANDLVLLSRRIEDTQATAAIDR